MKRIIVAWLLACTPVAAQDAKPPQWDARGLGPLPRMGITSIDVSDDGKEILVGTIAAFGDPNVLVLDESGKIVRTYKVGQRWIDQVAFLPGSNEALALCTMPAGRAGDQVEAFRLKGDQAIPEGNRQESPWFFHYGEHSNHPTMKLARAKNATALLSGRQLVVHRAGKEPANLRVPVNDPEASVSVAVAADGWTVVGTTSHEKGDNLFLFDPDKGKPVWSRAVNKEVEKAPALEKGQYGTPTLPDGTRAELPQRDEPVWAPLAVAIHSDGTKKRIAVADYQGWQRWVRSSATRKDDNQGLRFVPTKPTITVYDETGKVVQRYPAFSKSPFWCNLAFSPDGNALSVLPRHWSSRGLGGQPILPTDELATASYVLDLLAEAKKVRVTLFGSPLADFAHGPTGNAVTCQWTGHIGGRDVTKNFDVGGPAILRFVADTNEFIAARTDGHIFRFALTGNQFWKTDLNREVPKTLKPWVANARATPIVPGVWQVGGGRVESDLGGQRLVEGDDGYILIEGHAGLSFESEWASIEAVGLDPKKVKYVLATHEHGDHAPGAYLWRVVAGAKFVCSEEMAYTLQHHIPLNTGYGLHPPVPTDIRIAKDTELDLAGLKVRAIRIPGHTAGSMAWHFKKSGKTFVAFGDLIMPRGVLGYSGSVNFSARDALGSLRKLHDLNVDLVLPGHGAVEGPANYFQAGIDVGTKVGWGFIKPERPDPRFRLTQKNVQVVGWGQQAASAAFGDVNGDGKPDVVIVSPDGDKGSIVKLFLNQGGKFAETPDHELKVPQVDQPHKVRVTMTEKGPFLLVAGTTSALLVPAKKEPAGKVPTFDIVPFDLGDGNHLRFVEDRPVVSRRFGGFSTFDLPPAKPGMRRFVPEVDGPYVDFRVLGEELLTAYGQLYRRFDNDWPKTPTRQLPRDKDWTFLAVGDFNGDGKPDAAFLGYGMERTTSARIFYGRERTSLKFGEKEDVVLPLGSLLTSAKNKQTFPLVRDTPVVADWNGDGIDDLIVAHGQSDEVLVFLGGKMGLDASRLQRIALEYRVHYEHGVHVADFDGDGKADLALFGYTNTGVGAGGPPAVYVWMQR